MISLTGGFRPPSFKRFNKAQEGDRVRSTELVCIEQPSLQHSWTLTGGFRPPSFKRFKKAQEGDRGRSAELVCIVDDSSSGERERRRRDCVDGSNLTNLYAIWAFGSASV